MKKLYIGIQQLESNLLTPRIQAQAVGVHPVLALLAVLRVLWDFFRARIVVR